MTFREGFGDFRGEKIICKQSRIDHSKFTVEGLETLILAGTKCLICLPTTLSKFY